MEGDTKQYCLVNKHKWSYSWNIKPDYKYTNYSCQIGICSRLWCQDCWWCCPCSHTGLKEITSLYQNCPWLCTARVLGIYPIICLKSVCLATFAECSSQFLIDRLGRCLKLIASTRGTFCHEFASQFGLEFFYTRKNRKTTVVRPAAVDRRSVADKQLHLNGRNPFSLRSTVPRAQRENVVAECSDRCSNPVQGTIFFSFLLFAINKAYF